MNEQEINGLINDAICAALALKDAELATLKACVVKLQESLCAAKRQEYEAMVATPAQPIAPAADVSAPMPIGALKLHRAADELRKLAQAAFEAEYLRDAEDEECAARDKNGEYVHECAWAAWFWWGKGSAYSAAKASSPPDGYVLAPHYRGYANLGTGQYLLNHSRSGEAATLVISVATDEEKAGRVVGDERANPIHAALQPEAMAVRIDFTTVAGLDALENQLRKLRAEHFPSAKQGDAAETAPNWIECLNKTKELFPDNKALHHFIDLVHFEIRTKEDNNAN